MQKLIDFSNLHHIAIIASDYQKAKHFYGNILGLAVIRENHRPDKADIKLDFALNSTTELEIFVKPTAPVRPNYPEAQGLRHLAFNTEDIVASVNYLKSQAVEVEPIRLDDITQKKMTFFFDPDGLPLELHE
ncbi:glyoxalase [Weissella oryzae SG25]|uniref:Glyoxalase n=1 Tax=Weissella oryzae (strain DSM 25784 / JCM 18191 / LMG 30913 / SG25) TaxID=1329250 RepID=A0A069CV72_WEIOS|nr:VOC family protein [Weissella oryzae]GAK31359.1 glyoxalase [Weissella oryzae SG25]